MRDGGCVWRGIVHGGGSCVAGGYVWCGVVQGKGGGLCKARRACMVKGMHGERGACMAGACMAREGMHGIGYVCRRDGH